MSATPTNEIGQDWRRRIQHVLDGERIDTVFQPIIDTVRGVVAGYEALSRFPDRTVGGPDAWFSAARMHNLGAELEALALRRALAHRSSLPPNTFLTVNIAPDLLLDSRIQEVWAEHDSLRGVVIELTEQVAIDSYRPFEAALDALRSSGALIAVDDAGAGYSGLQHLLSLRPSIIKLDRSLIQDLDRDEAKRALVEFLGHFASRLDAWLLAEGVERLEELDALASLGVPLVQGFALGRPQPGWGDLDLGIARRLAAVPQQRALSALAGLVERAVIVLDHAAAVRVFAEDPAARAVVVVDRAGMPDSVLDAESTSRTSTGRGMRTTIDTPPAQVLSRAVTRRAATRFDPVIVTDDNGLLIGIVRIERLIDAVLGQIPEGVVVVAPDDPAGEAGEDGSS